jgi:hypothetical protein
MSNTPKMGRKSKGKSAAAANEALATSVTQAEGAHQNERALSVQEE